MSEENTRRSDLIHALSKLTSAQRSIERIEGLKTVKQNLKYMIEDVQMFLNNEKEQC